MVIKNVSLDIVCGITSKLPDTGRPEIAFAGKSNVGKSSLINGLLNRKALARTSSQPGKTQTINFYNVNDFMYLVDLPGYGYAKVPETEKAKWGKMIERYLHTSQTLKAVFLLIDIRHDPSANDKLMYDWIVNNGYNPIIIATKLDKLKRSQVQKNIKAIKDGLKLRPGSKIIPFSAETKQGNDDIVDQIVALHKMRGITIILVSHSMEDIAKYVERLIVMNHGEMVFDDTPKNVFSHYKELEGMGLAAPQITYIMHALSENGLNVDTTATTVEEARDTILEALKKQKPSLLKKGGRSE